MEFACHISSSVLCILSCIISRRQSSQSTIVLVSPIVIRSSSSTGKGMGSRLVIGVYLPRQASGRRWETRSGPAESAGPVMAFVVSFLLSFLMERFYACSSLCMLLESSWVKGSMILCAGEMWQLDRPASGPPSPRNLPTSHSEANDISSRHGLPVF